MVQGVVVLVSLRSADLADLERDVEVLCCPRLRMVIRTYPNVSFVASALGFVLKSQAGVVRPLDLFPGGRRRDGEAEDLTWPTGSRGSRLSPGKAGE